MLSDDADEFVFWRTLSPREAGRAATRIRHVRGLRRRLCGADRIFAADAAGDAGRRRGGRGLDLHLQLAGDPPAPDRLRAVHGEIGMSSWPGARPGHPRLCCRKRKTWMPSNTTNEAAAGNLL